MSKPIDLKTVKIFEPLSKKPEPLGFKEYSSLNPELVYEVLSNNSNETVTLWFKLQQAWCNNAYSTFKDYDSYLILVYLIKKEGPIFLSLVNYKVPLWSTIFGFLLLKEMLPSNFFLASFLILIGIIICQSKKVN